MSTVSKQIVDDIIAGKYADDEITKIVTYNNMFNGRLEYATVHRRENQLKYELSPACSNVKTYWLSKE